MQIESISGVSFKFCRPSGVSAREPSVAMTRALQALSEADEIREFVAEARAQRKDVVVEVFQSRDGQPLLIHPKAIRVLGWIGMLNTVAWFAWRGRALDKSQAD